MSSYSNVSPEKTPLFQLKGGLYPLTALQLLGTNLSVFEQQLVSKIKQAPKFFHNAPIVIDLQKLSDAIDYQQLIDILRDKKLIPIGIKGGTPQQQNAAARAGLALLHDNGKENACETNMKTAVSAEIAAPSVLEAETEIRGSNTKVITEPVRSGQQIYARGGDLIVLAPVSHGSELLADGNIHVYGPLRGRALAGITGDESTHIFCQNLEAELISIAGQYKISEDIEPSLWQENVDISLDNGRLHIKKLEIKDKKHE